MKGHSCQFFYMHLACFTTQLLHLSQSISVVSPCSFISCPSRLLKILSTITFRTSPVQRNPYIPCIFSITVIYLFLLASSSCSLFFLYFISDSLYAPQYLRFVFCWIVDFVSSFSFFFSFQYLINEVITYSVLL